MIRGGLNWAWSHINARKGAISFLGFAVICSSVAQVVTPALIASFVRDTKAGEPLHTLWIICIAVALVGVGQPALLVLMAKLAEDVSARLTGTMRVDLVQRLLRWPYKRLLSFAPSEIAEHIGGDVELVGRYFAGSILVTAANACTLIAILGIACYLRPTLGGCMLLFTLTALGCAVFFRSRTHVALTAAKRGSSKANATLMECATCGLDLAANRAESFGITRLVRENAMVYKVYRSANFGMAAATNVNAGLFALLTVATICWGYWAVSSGSADIGMAYMFIQYSTLLATPVESIALQLDHSQRALVSLKRLGEFVSIPAGPSHNGARVIASESGEIVFDQICYSYEQSRPVVHELSFFVPSGGLLCLYGKSGRGKTTVARLIARVIEPDSGKIALPSAGGEISPVCYVPQSPVLFPGSVLDNICCFDRSVTYEAVYDALALFCPPSIQVEKVLAEQITSALVGAELRQLIGLSRAVIDDTQVLILDEPLTNLDNATVERVVVWLRSLAGQRTVVIVTHDWRFDQLATVRIDLDSHGALA